MYDVSQPYPAQRAPVSADNMVATSQPLATQAGLTMLARGGNAVDAALASAITLTVVEPNNNGVGSDAFCMLWDGQKVVGLNASGCAPAGWHLSRFAGREKMPDLGWDAVTVPGAVSAWVSLSNRYGCLPFADLFEPAIRYAQDGFYVGPKSSHYWQLLASRYRQYDDFAAHFLPAPAAGEKFYRPELARTLEQIAHSHGESFYRGKIADAIVAASTRSGGVMNRADLESHEALWVQPTAIDYRKVTVHEIPPNGQGLAAQIALGILRHLDPEIVDSARWVHQQVEAMKIAIVAAQKHFADPRAMTVSIEALLEPAALADAAQRIGPRAENYPVAELPTSPDTVCLSAADASGMMVSFIQSNYFAFGSGVVIPETGISMQNRGSGFVLDPAHPNCVGPRKRPFHTIIPGFVTSGGAPILSFGVMGGHMQHQGHVQMVTRIFDHLQNPQAASDAPRWFIHPDLKLSLEPGFDLAVAESLAAMGHVLVPDTHESTYGGAQLIQRMSQGYVGGSDHRKEGYVGGY